ncbi:phage head closure protein [Bacillus sp. ISL-7]|uniref:phage head closure protein n=1 Tax=Bacillus sp. ISL-7 TaxID=2819136 RepID=UPI001BE697A3|nr:phage head closure protein [Bacillus sp. ISL-7]MBT2736162.1 phage head closure protein [Bacillus sp. ISL-7]
MNPGEFKHRIIFQQINIVKDELGQELKEWTDFKSVWCMIKTIQGREYLAAAATQNENTVRFVVRYASDIDSSMRIVYKGRLFEIVAPPINDDEQNKTLTIITREKVGENNV